MLARLSYLGRLWELGPDSGKKNSLLFLFCFLMAPPQFSHVPNHVVVVARSVGN